MSILAVDICNTLADVHGVLEMVLGPNPVPSSYYHPLLTDDFFEENLWIFEAAAPYEFSREVLNCIAKFRRIVYITARPIEARIITKKWLGVHGYPKGDIYFTDNKVSVCRNLGIKEAIDDAPFEIAKYIENGIRVLVKAQPYNTQYKNRFEWVDNLRLTA